LFILSFPGFGLNEICLHSANLRNCLYKKV
jgi:hypothetical protein